MITEYELYSDERYDRQIGHKYLVLGGVVCTDRRREILWSELAKVRDRFNLSGEMRWQKVSLKYLECYRAWVDSFFDDKFARFSMMVIDMSSPQWSSFRSRRDRAATKDDRLASVFYQFLLSTFGPLKDTKRWWVYPDAGYFSREDVLERVEFLFNKTYKRAFGSNTSRIIRLARSLDSSKYDLIQLADVLLAVATCAHFQELPHSDAKKKFVEYCAERWRMSPNTARGLKRLAVYTWVPPKEYEYRKQ